MSYWGTRNSLVAAENRTIQQNFNGSNTDGSFTMAVSNSFLLKFLGKKNIATDFGKFRVNFSFILKMVYCVYSLEVSK